MNIFENMAIPCISYFDLFPEDEFLEDCNSFYKYFQNFPSI